MDSPANLAGPGFPSHLRIGAWRVDPAANELDRPGETVRVEPKAMQVLVALAGRAGRVVTREALLAAVWPDVVVGDEVLTQTIIKLRRALGDHRRTPSYIETIPKRGYRLVAPTGEGDPVSHPATAPARRPNRWLMLATVVLLAAIVAGTYVRLSGGSDPKLADLTEERGSPLTVTVLPFESFDAGQRHLARGIGSDLMTDLSRLPGLRLISATGGTLETAIARGAQYVVSGSVQRESAMLRINVHLVDAATGQQIWSERFEGPYSDLFATQDEIARRLTAVLPAKLTDAAKQRLAGRYTRSLEAYDYFLRAQALFQTRQLAANDEARTLYRRALERDPGFARAYAGLAMTYAMDYRLQPPGEASTVLARAYELAESARQIDPDIPEVYWALAFVDVQSRRPEQAIESLTKAIHLNRSFADAYALMGGVYTYIGESAKTIPLVRTALRLNPEGSYLYFLILGRAYLFQNDLEQAIINLREAAARNPVDIETRVYLAAAQIASGNREAAEWEVVEIRALDAGFATKRWLETYPMSNARCQQRLIELLAQIGL